MSGGCRQKPTSVRPPNGGPQWNPGPSGPGGRQYSAMNAGKSTNLLQSDYNYRERGMRTLLFTPKIDNRAGEGIISSRLGVQAPAIPFSADDDLFLIVATAHKECEISCVFVDEAQFLTRWQVHRLSDICDYLEIPVLCYGLRTDFQGNLFEGSAELLGWADKISEIKTICHCGRKATMVLRLNEQGIVVREGDQVQIGDNDRYVSVCRVHFKRGVPKAFDQSR